MYQRRLLSTISGILHREYVYAFDDGLEVDELDGVDIVRRRVFFDDIVILTDHREWSWISLTVGGWFGLIVTLGCGGVMAAMYFKKDEIDPIVVAALAASIVLVWMMVIVSSRSRVLTVFGTRTRLELRFNPLRRKKFQEVEAYIVAQIEKTRQDVDGPDSRAGLLTEVDPTSRRDESAESTS